MTPILKNHFALARTDYLKGLVSGRYKNKWRELSVRPIPATLENIEPLMDRLSKKWHWSAQDRYQGGGLAKKMDDPNTELFELLDGDKVVGYALAGSPTEETQKRFFGAAPVKEIENLGLFPNEEGGGRGKSFFEMLFARYFPDYEYIYWSQNETHAPTLSRFYEKKMGMTKLGIDEVKDFRPNASRVLA